MALRPDEFYDHAVAAADDERRLPLSGMTGWDISPFEQDGLRVAPLRPPVLPEPARDGEDPSDLPLVPQPGRRDLVRRPLAADPDNGSRYSARSDAASPRPLRPRGPTR